ncbi:MAG: hypothetical protein HGJ94_17285 [Desulfosarcina sp.]|nr:hypothetical protein [Desulfosarcina sp.]MBC2742107.1 hypothetical protein [Desulfosarcina sp.]MBC2765020.1 hypothetical protein [Desulfosarcina sp.]
MTITDPITPTDIQYFLKKKGITQRSLAEKYGKSEMIISDVINFRRVSRPLMTVIAKEIDMKPETVFAWYFEGKGTCHHLCCPDANAA